MYGFKRNAQPAPCLRKYPELLEGLNQEAALAEVNVNEIAQSTGMMDCAIRQCYIENAVSCSQEITFDFEKDLRQETERKNIKLRADRIKKRDEDIKQASSCGGKKIAQYARKVDANGNSAPVVCMKWVEGLCIYGDECPELHTFNHNYLPTCAFFARDGACTREDCPYKHIVEEADRAFYHCDAHLRGFPCPLGTRCPDLHVPALFASRSERTIRIAREDRQVQAWELCRLPSDAARGFLPRCFDAKSRVILHKLGGEELHSDAYRRSVESVRNALHAKNMQVDAEHAAWLADAKTAPCARKYDERRKSKYEGGRRDHKYTRKRRRRYKLESA